MCTTFNTFKAAVESHLMQVDALYLADPVFVHHYKEHGPQCIVSGVIFERYKVNPSQALYDRQYLFGIILSATTTLKNKTILKYNSIQDGILAWDELKQDFAYDGSIDLKL